MKSSIIPERIRQARVSRGMSMADLAVLVGVTKQAISQYEMGTSNVSPLILRNIATTLQYNIGFFSKAIPTSNNSSSAIFFRKKITTKTKTTKAAIEKIEIFREIMDYLCNFVDFPSLNFPRIDYDYTIKQPIDNETIENYALTLRKHWNLGIGPIGNLMTIIQKNGFYVSAMDFGERKLDAFSVWYDNKPYIFLSKDKVSNARIRFDIAHELGHLLMHADTYNEEDIKNNKDLNAKLEDEANRFAGAFLMPKTSFSPDIYSTSIEHFINLKLKWLTSISSMIYRCESLNLLNENQIQYLRLQMTKRAYWYREPLDNNIPIETPTATKQAVQLIIDNNIVTPSQFIEAIGCYAEEIEKYCFLEKGYLSFAENTNTVSLKKQNIIDFNSFLH